MVARGCGERSHGGPEEVGALRAHPAGPAGPYAASGAVQRGGGGCQKRGRQVPVGGPEEDDGGGGCAGRAEVPEGFRQRTPFRRPGWRCRRGASPWVLRQVDPTGT